MKKASKILTLILVVVLLCGMFTGCAMFGRDALKYRDMTAITVGNEVITVGKVLDTFNNYYNNYYSYISAGYITLDQVVDMAVTSLYTQAMKVDSYVKTATAETHSYANFCHNAQYLTEKEITFVIKYVKYLTFQTFDNSVIDQLKATREIKDAEAEDTSRDFTEKDDLKGAATYAEYMYNQNFDNEDMTEYFDKYYANVTINVDAKADEYVYTTAEQAKAKIDEINERIEDEEDKIAFEDYTAAQKKIVNNYEKSILTSYYVGLEQFLKNQITDMVTSSIVAKYNYNQYKAIETDDRQKTLDRLQGNYQINKAAQAGGFELNDNFVSFIEGLSSSSYIYKVPQEYEGQYIFVKNILIPFTDSQKATLSNLASDLGSGYAKKPAYIALRNSFASKIVAEDFNTPKDEDGKHEMTDKPVFSMNQDKLIINPEGALNEFLSDGNVKGDDLTAKTQTIIDLMKQYNTDTAQHTAQYDYVVRVGETPSDYTAKWVPEFVEAAKEAKEGGIGSYALAISEYGVHIVFYSGDVVAKDLDFAAVLADLGNNTDTAEYRLFKSYYSTQSSKLTSAAEKALKKEYVDGNLIKADKMLTRFLKDNGLSYDFDKALKED